MYRVFADTGFFIALADETDKRYNYAMYCKQDFLERGYSFVFTDLVFAGLARPGRHGLNWRRTIKMGNEMLNSPEFGMEESAGYRETAWKDFFARYRDKEISFCDCVSFAVMKALRIKEVLTTDCDFEQVGLGFRVIKIKE